MSTKPVVKKTTKVKPVRQVEAKLKTVVRRLPPNLPEPVFWQSVAPWVTPETTSWKVFYPGKLGKGPNKENVPSRAYISFKNLDLLASFSKEYDGHLFRDKQGNESFAVVEFAPFQKVPSEKKKQDPRSGTITEDPDYISFIESLTAPTKPLTPEPVVQIENTTTPLLAALLAEKSAAKDSSQRFNGHIHPAMTAAMNRQEREKHRLEEEREFSRNGVPPTSIEPQKQMKDVKILTNSNANQGATSTATPSTPGKKSRKPSSSAPPTSPPKQKNSSSKPVSGDSSAQTKPERKRPVFKFETALAATPMTAANPDSKDDATKPSRRARQREKEKDKNDGPSHVATSSSNSDHPSAAPSPRPPKAKPVQSPPTHHSKKPSAKGHSEEGSIVPTRSPAAGIIAIQMTSHTPAERGGRGGRAPRGRGRGGGGGGGGNGGRGGAPS